MKDYMKYRAEIDDLRNNNIINQSEYEHLLSKIDPYNSFCETVRDLLESEIYCDTSSFFTPSDVYNILMRSHDKLGIYLK